MTRQTRFRRKTPVAKSRVATITPPSTCRDVAGEIGMPIFKHYSINLMLHFPAEDRQLKEKNIPHKKIGRKLFYHINTLVSNMNTQRMLSKSASIHTTNRKKMSECTNQSHSLNTVLDEESSGSVLLVRNLLQQPTVYKSVNFRMGSTVYKRSSKNKPISFLSYQTNIFTSEKHSVAQIPSCINM